MTSSVPEYWSAISAWLTEHAPQTVATFRPPDPTAVATTEAYLGQQLPVELADYLRVVPATWTPLLGMHFPLSAADMVADSAMRVQIADEILGDLEDASDEAGTPEHRFSRAFLTLTSDGGGDALFVDLRQGPLRGRITEWDKVDGSYSPEPREWAGVAPLLEDLLASLNSGSPFMWYFVPVTREGVLEWDWHEP